MSADPCPACGCSAFGDSDEARREIVAEAAKEAAKLAASEAQALDRRRGRRFAAWLAVITLVTGLGMLRTEAVVQQIRREAINRQVDACNRSNEFRIAYADDLLRRATPLDLAAAQALPEYQALPVDVRPIVDLFLTTIAADRADAAEVRRQFLAKFPIVDCDALRRSLG